MTVPTMRSHGFQVVARIASLTTTATADKPDAVHLPQIHARNKHQALGQLRQMPQLAMMKRSEGTSDSVHAALAPLLESHFKLFSSGENTSLMVRYAVDPAFKPFGRHITAAQALAEMTGGNDAGKTIHVILEVTDTGEPPLTRYRRAILCAQP